MFSATKLFMIILCFLGIVLLQGATLGHAITRRHRFEVRYSSHTRLCTNKTMLTINGQFPGPTIYARRGDLVIVDVINLSDHNITIHWHGVKMPRNPWSDGPVFITQCPVRPGTTFSQRVVLSDEEGTLWWHAHSEWFRATVYGALVILPPTGESYPFPKPHVEVPILLGEWWNADVQQVMEKFLSSGGADPDPSDAFLINGQPGALYNCSQADTFKLSVESGKTYLIRLVNAAMNFIMFFRIANHNITVVGADGAYTKPFTTDYIAISPGQTIDLLLEANQPPSRYYMASKCLTIHGDNLGTATTGFLDYVGIYEVAATPPLLPSFSLLDSTAAWYYFTTQLRSLARGKYLVDVPKNVTDTFLYTLSMNLRRCRNMVHGACPDRLETSINNVTWMMPNTDILQAYYRGIDGVYRSNFPDNPPFEFNYTQENLPRFLGYSQKGTRVKVLEFNATVELVFQGTHLGEGIDHPMHLHGYSFYVVGSGFGNFNRSKDPANYNLVDPPLMETIAVPKNGWTAIRFKANNPGVWFMHCHFERHFSWGLRMVFIVKDGKRPEEKMLPPPPDMPRC